MRRLFTSLCLAAVFVVPAFAGSSAPSAASPIPLDPTVLHGRLPNGLTYFIQHNTNPKGQVELRLAVNAGSVEEDEDQRGLAHVIEHLCFRGTRHFPNTEIVHYLQSLGSKFGADINGMTLFDDTQYRLSIPLGKPDALKNGLLMLRDWAGDVSFDQPGVDKERKVVMEEWRLGRGAAQRMLQKEAPVLFQGSRYASRIPIGLKAVIEGAPLSTIARYYHDWYRPDNMAVVVVGDVDPQAILAQLTALFGDLKNPAHPRTKPDLAVPIPSSAVCSSATDPEMGYTAIRLWYPQATKPVSTVADYREQLARQLVLQALNTRLAELQERTPSPYEFAQASFGPSPARSMTVASLVAIVQNGAVPAGLTALVQEGDLVSSQGFTQAEFDRSRADLLKAVDEHYAERDHRESSTLAADYVGTYLDHAPAPGPEWRYTTSKALLASLTLRDMDAACRSLFGEKGLIVSVEEPQSSKTVSDTQLTALVAKARATQLTAYHEKALPKTLMATLPAPGRIVSRKTIAALGVTELMLSNGVRVVLKPSTFKQDEIVFSAYRPGGLALLPDNLVFAGQLAPYYALLSGIGSFSATDLQKILAGRVIQIVTPIQPNADAINGKCTTVDLETALQLVHLRFAPPRRDPAAYQTIVNAMHSNEANVLMNPTLSFLNEVLDIAYNHNPRAPRFIQPESTWKALTLDKVIQAYDERFGTAGGFTFFFVGSFKESEIEPLLTRYLGSLPEGNPKAEYKDVGLREIPGPFQKTILRGTDPKALVMLDYERPVAQWNFHQSHILWSMGNILQRALIDRLRIDQGSVYTLKVQSEFEKIPYSHYSLDVEAPCAPKNTAEVIKVVNEEIVRLQTQGPTAAEIEKEVASQKHDIQVQAEKNGDWLWKLQRIYQYGEPFERLETPDALVNLVTPANIRDAAKTYLATDKWLCFEMEPKSP